ncbi:MAG: hydroxymethylbilane synthase [Gemmatimonadales bacterium]
MTRTASAALRLGTRPSALARAQAELVRAALHAAHPDLPCELVPFTSEGDRDLETPLPEIGGKGVFTADLERAILSGALAGAVHSLKDLPTDDVPGLVVAAVLERADPADVLVSRSKRTLAELPASPAVGTSSLRRAAQVLARRPDARIVPLRGNVQTRVRKAMDPAGPYDAVVLAAAGLARLGVTDVQAERLSPETFLPAPGQGAVAIQCARAEPLIAQLRTLNHAATWAAVSAERAFLAALGAGCSAPVGAFGRVVNGQLVVDGIVAARDGTRVVRVQKQGMIGEPEALGRALADEARGAGAADLLEEVA